MYRPQLWLRLMLHVASESSSTRINTQNVLLSVIFVSTSVLLNQTPTDLRISIPAELSNPMPCAIMSDILHGQRECNCGRRLRLK